MHTIDCFFLTFLGHFLHNAPVAKIKHHSQSACDENLNLCANCSLHVLYCSVFEPQGLDTNRYQSIT